MSVCEQSGNGPLLVGVNDVQQPYIIHDQTQVRSCLPVELKFWSASK